MVRKKIHREKGEKHAQRRQKEDFAQEGGVGQRRGGTRLEGGEGGARFIRAPVRAKEADP